jgi:transcriptional regulator with GAF, ATPase, and Fis domain
MGKAIGAVAPDVLRRLTAYPWPGNVRELQNVIERAVILSSRGRLELGELIGATLGVATPGAAAATAAESASGPARRLEAVEREHILSVLERTGWRVSGQRGAAALLGLKRTTLEARMKKLGIQRQV